MKVQLEELSKRYLYDWIFKSITHTFDSNSSTAITGNNGSGKSTILKIILGIEQPSKGAVSYFIDERKVDTDDSSKLIDFIAPYQSLIEEFSTQEMIDFHFKFKNKNNLLFVDTLLEETNLKKESKKTINNFSSGMKQRLKLILAFSSDSPLLLLDEPTVNLDQQGIDWYRNTIKKLVGKKTIIISSNQLNEYDFCQDQLNILDYKV